MTLREKQTEFMWDLIKLLTYIKNCGYDVTGGELLRTCEMQEIYLKTGKSKVKHSRHQDKLAIDLNIFINGKLVYVKKELQHIGDFWEGLNSKNKWGGNYKSFIDTPHFEKLK